MSKSLGNVILLKDMFKKHGPMVVRFFVLQSHYRGTLDFTDEAMEGASKGYEKLINTVRNVREARLRAAKPGPAAQSSVDLGKYRAEFLAAMNDDLNTPQAIAVLFNLCREINGALAKGEACEKLLTEADALFRAFGGTVLGLVPEKTEPAAASAGVGESGMIDFIMELRNEARAQKLWAFSDKIRDGLLRLGIVLEDKKEGTTWRKA
jgi:cysteinyl-tRNA synthetase